MAKTEKVETEAMETVPEKLVKEGVSLIKLENDTQMMISIQRPRDEEKILKACLKELDTYRSCADEALYIKPVGKNDKGEMQFADSLSIRAAESLANRWTNNAYACDKIDEDDESITLAGIWLDYETNIRRVLLKRVSKSYTQRATRKRIYHNDDRLELVVSANQSKLLREVILRNLPAGLKKEYENKAWQLLETEDREKKLVKIKRLFEQHSITLVDLASILGKELQKASNKDLIKLGGMFNSLRDGEITKEALLGKPVKPVKPEGEGLKVKPSEKVTEEALKEHDKRDTISLLQELSGICTGLPDEEFDKELSGFSFNRETVNKITDKKMQDSLREYFKAFMDEWKKP